MTQNLRTSTDPNPPLLTGGLTHLHGVEFEALSRGVDGVTATVGTIEAAQLIGETEELEAGYARHGFQRSEQRKCMGGELWRRWEPIQASERWGKAYESWDALGYPASWLAERLRSIPSRASRVDVAWDFQVDDSTTPDTIAEAIRSHVDAAGITLGISGQGDRNTRYVGSSDSDRRVCIYRKDWETPGFVEMFGPTLRVELRLRGEHAAAWWDVWRGTDEGGYAVACGHVAQMCGFRPQDGLERVPQIVPPDGADAAAELFQFAKQHGGRIDAWIRAGVDVAAICKLAADGVSRRTSYRLRQKAAAIAAVGAPVVVAQVAQMLAHR